MTTLLRPILVSLFTVLTLLMLVPAVGASSGDDPEWVKIHGVTVGCPSAPWHATQQDGKITLTGKFEWAGSTYQTKHFQHDWVTPDFTVVKQTRDTDVCQAFKVRLIYTTADTPKYTKLRITDGDGAWLETSAWRTR